MLSKHEKSSILPFNLLFIGFLVIGIQVAYAEDQTLDAFEKAEILLEQKKHSESLVMYEEILTANPAYVAAYPKMLQCYAALGDPEGGAVFIESLYLEDPDNAGVNYGMGYVLFQQKQYEAAASYFDRAIALDPGLAESWNNRAAIFHFIEHDYQKAAHHYRRAIALGKQSGNQRVVDIAQTNLDHLPKKPVIVPVTEALTLEEFINRFVAIVEQGDEQKLDELVMGQKENCEKAMDWLLEQADLAEKQKDTQSQKTAMILARILAKKYHQSYENNALLSKLERYASSKN